MKTSGVNLNSVAVLAVVVGVGAVALYVWKKGGIANAATSAGGAAVDAAEGVAVGVVGGIGERVGLPTPDETTTDPAVARWIIDNYGQLQASKWASAWAYARAQFMSEGSGTSPVVGTPLANYLATQPRIITAYTDESDRLLQRYPAPPSDAVILDGTAWPGYGWGGGA